MLLREKIVREQANRIQFYREGLFWKLYNRSAFNFSMLVKPYAVKKKYFKELKEEIVSIGFPDAILKEILEKLKSISVAIQASDKVVEVELKETVEGYEEWFERIKVTEDKIVEKSDNKEILAGAEGILRELREFPIMQKTPLEVQLFVLDLQNKLKKI